jgi:VWFA-related protein
VDHKIDQTGEPVRTVNGTPLFAGGKTIKHSTLTKICLLLFVLCLTKTTLVDAQETEGGLTASMGQIDNSNYPNITIYVNVTDENGKPVTSLTESDFAVTEDGKEVRIIDFAGVTEARPVDVVFVFDTTGSMGEEIEGVKQTAIEFARKLRENNRDFRLGLISFGDLIVAQYNEDGTLTANEQEFQSWVASLSARGGGMDPENSFEALQVAAKMKFRDDAQIVFLLITDAPPHHYGDLPELDVWVWFNNPDITLEKTLEVLEADSVAVYAITIDDPEFIELADNTGGKFYDLERNPDFTSIIDEIGQVLANQYKISYRSSRPTPDGTRRGIVVTVGKGINQAITSGEYLEQHLLNIHSDWLIGLLFSLPLLIALFIPLRLHRAKASRLPAAIPQQSPIFSHSPPLSGHPSSPPTADTTMCPRCQQPVPATAKFCRSCGYNLQAMPVVAPPTCQSCASPLTPGVKFCSRCGRRVG